MSIWIQCFSCLPGLLLFQWTCWCCQVPYSPSHFDRCWFVCWFSSYSRVTSLLPSRLSSLPFFLPSSLSPIWGQTTWKILSSAHKKVTLATSSASSDSVTKCFIKPHFFSSVGASPSTCDINRDAFFMFEGVTGTSKTTCISRIEISCLEEDLGLIQGDKAVVRAALGGVVCWAKLGCSMGLLMRRYEDEEVLLLHRALVTLLTFLLGRIPFLRVRNSLVCLLGPLWYVPTSY